VGDAEPVSSELRATERRFGINNDRLYTPPEVILLENFSTDIPHPRNNPRTDVRTEIT
jgi:hypothetical protein